MERDPLNETPGRARITLIDDDAAVLRGVGRLVRSHGYFCTTIESGEQALAHPAVAESDCLIMDVQLDGMDGFETRDRLHQMGIRIPTIFITANSEFDSPEWVARRKGSPCLLKPFEEIDLITAIQKLL